MRKLIILLYIVIIVGSVYVIKSFISDNKYYRTTQALNTTNMLQIDSDFELLDSSGRKVTSRDFPDKIMLIYFGFTYCPDICPTELNKLGEILNLLGENSNKIQPIFITIDPDRDNLIQLKSYMEHFDSRIIALGGSSDQIKKVADNYKVYYNKIDNNGQNYLIDHSSLIYVIGYDGKLITNFHIKMSAKEIYQQLEQIIGK